MARSLNDAKIPPGWKYEYLDRVASRCSGHTPSKSHDEYWNGEVRWISLTDSYRLDKGYVYDTDKKISKLGVENSSAEIHPAGTVVISRDAGIGKSGVMAEPMAVSQHFIAWKCDDQEGINNWFLYNWLQYYKREFERQAVGSTIKTIGLPYFKKLRIALPSIQEQQKIAKILSTWDDAIATTEQLLANSEQQKKALMQQLLTGKKRLPGFEEEWSRVRLGDLGRISSSGVDKKTNSDELRVRLLNYLDVFKREFIFNCELEQGVTAPKSKILACDVRKGDIFFTPSSETRKDLAMTAVAAEDMPGVVYSYHVIRLRPKNEMDLNFSAYIFQTDLLRRQAYRAGDGSGQRYVISQDEFRAMELTVPPLAEQKAIGGILRSASMQVECLVREIKSLQAEKKGLMQRLLTGQRRVKVDALKTDVVSA